MEAKTSPKMFDIRLHPVSCRLKHIVVSNNLLRYFMVTDDNNADLLYGFDDNNGVPLFLAKDVFSTCDLMQNNVQRIHARYSKKGLATKVNFEDFRIEGVCQNKMWFYSIQGLFEVVFHYHKRDVQKDCLKLLADVWLQQCDDKLLPDTLSVSLNEETANTIMSAKGLLRKPSTSQNEKFIIVGTNSSSNKQTIVNRKCTPGFMLPNESTEENSELESHTDSQAVSVDILLNSMKCTTCEVYTQTDDVIENCVDPINDIPLETTCIGVHVAVQTDHIVENFNTLYHCHSEQKCLNDSCNYYRCTPKDQGSSITKCPYCLYLVQHDLSQNPAFNTFLIKLNQFIMFMYSETDKQFLEIFSKIISIFLDNFPKLIMPESFLIEFFKEFQYSYPSFDDENDMESKFLNFVSKWVGTELHKFEDKISIHCAKFMQSHIKCIDNLPPPEEIIDEIFPLCMKELIFHWMNPQNIESCDKSCDSEFADHIYSQEQKRFKSCSNKPDFHVIQLILEFANNALISGVAHVVYSRIKSSHY